MKFRQLGAERWLFAVEKSTEGVTMRLQRMKINGDCMYWHRTINTLSGRVYLKNAVCFVLGLLALAAGGPVAAGQNGDVDRLANVIVDTDSPDFAVEGGYLVVDGYLPRTGKAMRGKTTNSRFTYSARLPHSGVYRVYAWWPSMVSGAGYAEIALHDRHGVTVDPIDQSDHGGMWYSIGAFDFTGGRVARVQVRGGNGRSAVAAALRFEFIGLVSEPFIESEVLPLGTQDAPYYAELSAVARPPITWNICAGKLPDGVHLDSKVGKLIGRPAKMARYDFRVCAIDGRGHQFEKPLSIDIMD